MISQHPIRYSSGNWHSSRWTTLLLSQWKRPTNVTLYVAHLLSFIPRSPPIVIRKFAAVEIRSFPIEHGFVKPTSFEYVFLHGNLRVSTSDAEPAPNIFYGSGERECLTLKNLQCRTFRPEFLCKAIVKLWDTTRSLKRVLRCDERKGWYNVLSLQKGA